jgi:hypothetical protein
VKSQFDPNQSVHLAAVAAVTDLLDGRPQDAPEYAVINVWGEINPSPFISHVEEINGVTNGNVT